MSAVRLQKFLSECGVASRRKAEELIVEGRVRINGKVSKELGVKVDPYTDQVYVDRKPVARREAGMFLFHKPVGVVCTRNDPEGRETIQDFLPRRYQNYFSVGRLDYNTSGLLLLTNDGDLANRLMHPRYQMERVYEARVSGRVTQKTLEKIRNGVQLKDGPIKGKAKILKSGANSTWLEITLSEGRNKAVRRLMDHLGHPVSKLRRSKYGPFHLGYIPVGKLEKVSSQDFLDIKQELEKR